MIDHTVIYSLLQRIPAGKVTTYGTLAKIVGTSPRVVGNILHKNPSPQSYPCHRVVNSRGEIAANFAFGGVEGQRQKLVAEGVTFITPNQVAPSCITEALDTDAR